ncbi:MAG: acyltransferase, partial [Acidimicrobiia bacterium]|nr:acyltransferase [Acidimicrobiia bacterium]
MTTTLAHPSGSPALSASSLAEATPTDRNRAVDFYRAAAMGMVAVGHWLGMVVVMDHGKLTGGNLLDFSPGYAWFTWIGQVMPLFFFVGGFASATSLRSAERKGVRPADWVATRLRRMTTPAAALAGFWLLALAVGAAVGGFGIVALGAVGAAIPLWFLANYTIDTALAPFTFRWFRTHPWRLVGGLVALFTVAETARFAGVPVLPEISWVIGWLGFQVAGFAWQDGRLPTGRALAGLAATFWALALAAVAFGPWPMTMLHHGGLELSPTHPPSTALILFGLAYSFTAAALAPAVTRWLERSQRAWQRTIAANSVAMSVYLWHMTAAMTV